MAVFPVGNASVSLGDALAFKQTPFIASDFSAVTYVAIGQIETVGAFGDEQQYAEFASLGTGRIDSIPTLRKGAVFTVSMAMDELDTGQAAIIAAAANQSIYYPLKIVFDNSTTGDPGQVEFLTRVSPMQYDELSAGSVLKWTASFAVSSNTVHTNRTTS